jgi:hypothetical protein
MEPGKHHRLSHQSDSSVSDAAPARRRGGVRALGILRTVASHRIKDNHGTPYREKKPELGTASTYVPNNTCNAAKSPRRAIHLQPSARNANAVPRTNAVAIPVRGSIWRRDARSHALVTVMAMISAPSIQHPASSTQHPASERVAAVPHTRGLPLDPSDLVSTGAEFILRYFWPGDHRLGGVGSEVLASRTEWQGWGAPPA